jgi:hypothetical protein
MRDDAISFLREAFPRKFSGIKTISTTELTLYGPQHYWKGHQLCRHSIVSQHFMEPEGSLWFQELLAGFCPALKLALGGDTEGYIVFYIDDNQVHSWTFEEHLVHLDTVIGKLTQTGFAQNVAKKSVAEKKQNSLGTILIEDVYRPIPQLRGY